MSVPDTYHVNFFATGVDPVAGAPSSQFTIGPAQIIGNQTPIASGAEPFVNPTAVYLDDPVNEGKQIHAAIAPPSAFGNYQMNVSGLSNGAEGPRSNTVAITIQAVPPPAPTGVFAK